MKIKVSYGKGNWEAFHVNEVEKMRLAGTRGKGYKNYAGVNIVCSQDIIDLMEMAYEAGKLGEKFEYSFLEEKSSWYHK